MGKEVRKKKKIKLIFLFSLLVIALILFALNFKNIIPSYPIKEFYNENVLTVDSILDSNASNGKDVELIGLLYTPTTCWIEWCDMRPSVTSLSEGSGKVYILGDGKKEDNEKLIKAYGKINVSFMGIYLELNKYEIIYNGSYLKLLIADSQEVITKRFGCAFSHSKQFRLEREGNSIYGVVRWLYFGPKEGERGIVVHKDKYIDLYYTLRGKFAKFNDQTNGTKFCP